MARRSHGPAPEEAQEDIRYQMRTCLSIPMRRFLELEAKRLSAKVGRRLEPPDIVRALITSYYEKRMAGLLVNPDD